MGTNSLNRRQLGVAAAGAGLAALATPVQAQTRVVPASAADFGAVHRGAMDLVVSDVAKGSDLTRQAGLTNMVKYLANKGGANILTEDEAAILLKLIEILFKETWQAALKYAQAELDALRAKGERLLKALLSIVIDSLTWIQGRIKDPKNAVWVDIVGADLGGALTGAIAGIPGGPPSVLAGALFGAIGASALAGAKALLK
jgi:hypothetical protein